MATASRSLVRAALPCLALVVGPSAITAAESVAFAQVVKPFIAKHCTSCHGPEKQKGDLRLDTITTDFASPATAGHWMEVMERINSGDMPPKKEARPAAADIARVADWITGELTEADRARQRNDHASVTYSRLTREEYRNSIRDLLGVTVDVFDPTGLPEDPAWHGFERIGSVLTLSPAHIEKYLIAADLALSEAIALDQQPELLRETYDAVGLRRIRHDLRDQLTAQGVLDQVRVDVVPNNTVIGHPGEGNDVVVKVAGEYRFRVKLSALRPEGGRAPRLLVYAASISRTLYEGDVEAPIDQPATIEFSAHLPVGRHQIRLINAVPGPRPEDRRSRPINNSPFFTLQRRLPWQMKLTDEAGKPLWPLMVVDFWDLAGPLQASWPPPAHQQLFTRAPDAAKDAAYARDIIARFATRAWRRPVEGGEIDRLVRLAEKDRSLGNSFEASVKTALQAVLCSPRFLFLAEGSAGKARQQLDPWELASRLSYFLWSTLPDEQLTRLAASGQLLDRSVLRGEVRRMLSDAKAAAFTDSFPRQWLRLRQVGMFAPDSKLYPDYDDHLQTSMIAESVGYFREVLANNLSVREFLASDWTMLNERLASHYGIAGVAGDAMRRVALKPEDHRGGLLTQGAILSMTSDGTRHRPVHRGVWVLEAIIGKPPPPPPANVPAISADQKDQPKQGLRAKLEAHRADERCASCHAKIDPLGLAFDHYDAIGRWRTAEKVQEGSGEDPKIDASGELIDGRKFADHDELKRLLVADLPQFAAALTDHLATYALRRGMSFADRKDLHAIAAAIAANGWRLGDLVEHLVVSDLFQRR
jgi:mono/diheme cytochrome c family protein